MLYANKFQFNYLFLDNLILVYDDFLSLLPLLIHPIPLFFHWIPLFQWNPLSIILSFVWMWTPEITWGCLHEHGGSYLLHQVCLSIMFLLIHWYLKRVLFMFWMVLTNTYNTYLWYYLSHFSAFYIYWLANTFLFIIINFQLIWILSHNRKANLNTEEAGIPRHVA